MSFDRLLKTLGIEEMPEDNKTERLVCTLRHLFQNWRLEVPDFLNMLISNHKLGDEDFRELGSYLIHLGLVIARAFGVKCIQNWIRS